MKKIATIMFFLTAAIIFPPTQAHTASQQTEIEEPKPQVIAEDTPLYEQIMPRALKWKDAILSTDAKALAEISYPYERKAILKAIQDKTSPLYNALYKDAQAKGDNVPRKSPYTILKAAKKIKITIVALKPIAKYGVIVYYYDTEESHITIPPKDETQAEEQTDRTVACPFQWSGTTWYADFMQTYAPATQEEPSE